MSDEFEVEGHWWLPDRPDHEVAGTLRFDLNEGARLSLIGALQTWLDLAESTTTNGETEVQITQSLIEEAGIYPRIHGRSSQGRLYTLFDCVQTHSSGPVFAAGIERIRIRSILSGALFALDESADFEGMAVQLAYLPHWIDVASFREENPLTGRRDPRGYSLELDERGHERRTLADGAILRLTHRASSEGDGIVTRTLRQHYWFGYRRQTLCTSDELLDIASDLQDLVSIGTGRTAVFESVDFVRSDVRQPSLAGTDLGEMSLDYKAQWNVRDRSRKPGELDRHRMFFSYSDIGGLDGVQAWLTAAEKYRSPLGRVMTTRYQRGMFTSDRFLNCAAALESFDRSRTGTTQSAFQTRIKRCAGIAGDGFRRLVGDDVHAWAMAVKADRDDIAHHFGRRMKEDTPDQYYLYQSLYWLFILCMLREANMPDVVFEKIEAHQDIVWQKPKIQAAVAASVSA